jgi:hypothetical protein
MKYPVFPGRQTLLLFLFSKKPNIKSEIYNNFRKINNRFNFREKFDHSETIDRIYTHLTENSNTGRRQFQSSNTVVLKLLILYAQILKYAIYPKLHNLNVNINSSQAAYLK